MFVYAILNDINGMFYIGKTVSLDLEGYFKSNVRDALNGKKDRPRLYNAIRKYGPANFRIVPLISTLTSDSQLCHWETELIALFKARDKKVGYNEAPGGRGCSMLKSPEHRRKIANALMGRKHSEQRRLNIIAGRAASPKAKIPWNKGKAWHIAPDHRKRINEGVRRHFLINGARCWTPEQRLAQSERMKQQPNLRDCETGQFTATR